MDISAIAGRKLFVTATLPATFDKADLATTATAIAAVADFVQVKGVSNYGGDGGDSRTEITYDIIDENRTKKAKGTTNGGTRSYTYAINNTDAGQVILEAGVEVNANYFLKEVWADGYEVYYLGLIGGEPESGGGSNTVNEKVCSVMVNSPRINSIELAAA